MIECSNRVVVIECSNRVVVISDDPFVVEGNEAVVVGGEIG